MKQQVKEHDEESADLPVAFSLGTASPEAVCAWWEDERFMDASRWWSLKNVPPDIAAMLLCRLNPEYDNDPESTLTDKTTPRDYRRLLVVFQDVAHAEKVDFSLQQWLETAQERQLKYHPWIDEWRCARAQIDTIPNAGPAQEKEAPTAGRVYGPKVERKKNILDSVIDKAIEQARSEDTADVFLKIRNLAMEETPPFTGIVTGEGLEYTDSENKKKLLSKDALAKRLKRRRDKSHC